MDDYKKSHRENQPSSEKQKRLSAEQWVMLAGVVCLFIFLWMIVFLFLPALTQRSSTAGLSPFIVKIIATGGFTLPPTWTPGPTQEIITTPTPTEVYDGTLPTRIYTPRPTSLPGVPFPFVAPQIDVVDLARIMQGESPGDPEAAYYVGWVAKNRLLHLGYGDTYAVVSHGFFGYRADIQPNETFLQLAHRVIRDKNDPTGGCLYALSRTDITKLRVPPQRADVTKGEWFFFRIWPLAAR